MWMWIAQFLMVLLCIAGAYVMGVQVESQGLPLGWGFVYVLIFVGVIQSISEARAKKRVDDIGARVEALEARLTQPGAESSAKSD